jgi:hypothetical protein
LDVFFRHDLYTLMMKPTDRSAILRSGIAPSYQTIAVDEVIQLPSPLLPPPPNPRTKAWQSVSLDDFKVPLPKTDVAVAVTPRVSHRKKSTTGYESFDFSRR